MKKLLAVLLSLIISLSLFGCAAKEAGGDTVPTQEEAGETEQTKARDDISTTTPTEGADETTVQTESPETVPGETEAAENTSESTQTDPTNSETAAAGQGTDTSKNNGNTSSSAPTQSSSNQTTTPTGSGNNNTTTTPTSPSTVATEPTPTTKPTEPTPTTAPTTPPTTPTTPATQPTEPTLTTPTTQPTEPAPTTAPTEPAPTTAPTEPAPTETTPKETEPQEHTHTFVATPLSTAAQEDVANGGFMYAYYVDFTDWIVDRCSECGFIDMASIRFRYTDYEAAVIMLGYVNDLRAEVYGTHEYDLVLDDTLFNLATIRANELTIVYSHGGTFTNAGENICAGYKSIYEQFIGWKNSPGHYKNMIYKDYKYFAYATTSGNDYSTYLYGVQLFWTEKSRNAYFM